ncbi:MAG: hypothetical protein JSW08_00755 [archaeon]|nr:MAG: hypothetical protein JSW08_00755 [archaeon]
MKLRSLNKKAAFEMSVSTMVIIVIAVVLLVLGLVFVRQIFGGATENVLSMNEKVKAEINKLFSEDNQGTALYLSDRLAEIKQGEAFGVAFAIRNIGSRQSDYGYTVKVSDSRIMEKCGISASDAEYWIVAGESERNIPLGPGDTYYTVIRFEPDLDAPLCLVRFRVDVTKGPAQTPYDTFGFDVRIKAK